MQRSLAAAIGVAGALAIGGAVLAGSTQYRAEPAGTFEIPATNSTAEGATAFPGGEIRDQLHVHPDE